MNRPSPQPDLVLFDLDDTLCDYASARTGRLRIAFGLARDQAGADFTAPLDEVIADSIRVQPHGVDRFPEILARYGIDDQLAAKKAIDWFVANRFHGLHLFPDAIETLQTVRAGKAHRRLGLVTNGPADVQTAKIEMLGLQPYFDFMLISGVFGYWKPDRQIFLEALSLGRATGSDSIMIGDSPEHDMAGAEAAGLSTIWMDRAGRAWPREIPSPTYIAPDLATVRRLLAPATAVR